MMPPRRNRDAVLLVHAHHRALAIELLLRRLVLVALEECGPRVATTTEPTKSRMPTGALRARIPCH